MIRALLGGSFDPVHAGHVAMVRHVLRHSLADHVVVVPNWRSPWRPAPVAGPADRLAMCRLAFAAEPATEVDAREIDGKSPAYTVETLAALAAEAPEVRWRLVIGGDHLAGFGNWRDAPRILALAELIVLQRSGCGEAVADGSLTGRLVAAPPFDNPVSASAIRAMLAAGSEAGAMLPPAVAAYIDAHRLYRSA